MGFDESGMEGRLLGITNMHLGQGHYSQENINQLGKRSNGTRTSLRRELKDTMLEAHPHSF